MHSQLATTLFYNFFYHEDLSMYDLQDYQPQIYADPYADVGPSVIKDHQDPPPPYALSPNRAQILQDFFEAYPDPALTLGKCGDEARHVSIGTLSVLVTYTYKTSRP